MNRRLIFDTDVKAIREEKLMGLRPEIYDEYDLIDAVPDADLSELWIPFSEGLPEKGVLVLCVGSRGGMFLGQLLIPYQDRGEAWCSVPNARYGRTATHWMPLPGVPKKDDRA